MDFKIRAEETKDQTAIKVVNDLAFGQENESKLIAAIRKSKEFIPQLSLVAESDEGEIIGHILFSTIYIETSTGVVPTLGLAPMAVIPGFQNQGVGTALVRKGLEKCMVMGYKHAVVLGHPNFYPEFGFVTSKEKGIESPFPVPDHVFMVCELTNDSLKGVNGKVKYPPTFDSVS